MPWISEDLPEPATPVTTVRMPRGMSTSTSLRLCCVAPRISSTPFAERMSGLSRGAVVEVAAGDRVGGAKPRDIALVLDLSPAAAGAGPEVDHVVGDLDHLGLVLDDQDGVALVAQRPSSAFIRWMSWGCRPAGRLVEDVGDVGEGGAQVADHLRALRLAARSVPAERSSDR